MLSTFYLTYFKQHVVSILVCLATPAVSFRVQLTLLLPVLGNNACAWGTRR